MSKKKKHPLLGSAKTVRSTKLWIAGLALAAQVSSVAAQVSSFEVASVKPVKPLAGPHGRRETRPRRTARRGPARDRRRRAAEQHTGSGREVRAAPRSRRHARPRRDGDDGSNLCAGPGSNCASGCNGRREAG